jgi:hypothetical protein
MGGALKERDCGDRGGGGGKGGQAYLRWGMVTETYQGSHIVAGLGCVLHPLSLGPKLGGAGPPVTFTSQQALGGKAGTGRPGCCPVDLWFKSVTRDGVWTSPR